MVIITEYITESENNTDVESKQTLVPMATQWQEGCYMEKGQLFITNSRNRDGVI